MYLEITADGHSLCAGENGENDVFVVVGVGTFRFPEGGAAVKLVVDIGAGDVGIIGNDGQGLLAVKGGSHVVDEDRFEDHAQYAEQSGLDVKDEEGGGGDENVGAEEGIADVHAGILFDDESENVGAAGGALQIKNDSRADGGENNGEDELQQLLVGEGGRHGTEPLQQGEHAGEQGGTVHGADTEVLLKYCEAQREEQNVDNAGEGGSGDAGDESSENDRDAGHAAEGEMIGEFEKVVADGHKEDTEGHKQVFFYELFVFQHGKHPFEMVGSTKYSNFRATHYYSKRALQIQCPKSMRF